MKVFLSSLFFTLTLFAHAQIQMTAEKWQEDLQFLQQTVHQDYAFLFRKTSADEFDAAVRELQEAIPTMADHEVVVGLARIIALFKYGHTGISYGHEAFAFRHFPFNLYHFSDGVYVQGTHKKYREALGARVVSIGGMPIAEALHALSPAVNAENSQFFKAYGINDLRIAEVLHAQRITPSLTDTLTLGLEKEGKAYELTFTALPKGERPPTKYGLVLQQEEWLDARDTAVTPYYLKYLDKNYYYEYLPDARTVYVRHSEVVHEEGEDIPTFFGRVFDFIENNAVDRLVLDVRLNGGGNNYFNKDVVRGIIQTEKIDQVGKLFVIIGRRTFSACQNLVLELDSYTNAIFVGEPTGENINFYGDNNRIPLPNSGIPVYLSYAWWQDKPQWEDGPWLAPHVAVEMSFEAYKTNQDPVLDTALKFDAGDFELDPMQYMTALYMAGEQEKLLVETQKMIADPRYRFYDFEAELSKAGARILSSGDPGQAIAVFEFVGQLFPESAGAWVQLGNAYRQAGQADKAVESYKKALALDPNGAVGQDARGQLVEMGRM